MRTGSRSARRWDWLREAGIEAMPDDHHLALEALAADIVELAGGGIIAADEDGRILVFNQAAEETFG